jgi:hypothetical protein
MFVGKQAVKSALGEITFIGTFLLFRSYRKNVYPKSKAACITSGHGTHTKKLTHAAVAACARNRGLTPAK